MEIKQLLFKDGLLMVFHFFQWYCHSHSLLSSWWIPGSPMARYSFPGSGRWPQCLCVCAPSCGSSIERRWLQQQYHIYSWVIPTALITTFMIFDSKLSNIYMLIFFADRDGNCLLHETSLTYSSQQGCCLHTVQCAPRAQNGIWWRKATWAIQGDLSNLHEWQRNQVLLCWPHTHPTLEINSCGMRRFI